MFEVSKVSKYIGVGDSGFETATYDCSTFDMAKQYFLEILPFVLVVNFMIQQGMRVVIIQWFVSVCNGIKRENIPY
jgi:hypothetical protein